MVESSLSFATNFYFLDLHILFGASNPTIILVKFIFLDCLLAPSPLSFVIGVTCRYQYHFYDFVKSHIFALQSFCCASVLCCLGAAASHSRAHSAWGIHAAER